MDPSIVDAVSSSAHPPSSRLDGSELIQLVDKDGAYENAAFENLCKQINLAQFGVSYKIVAIIGPQSSGKSTLLNHLFHTNFQEMDAMEGRSKTTNGIWLGYQKEFTPGTLVMDIEGSDGSERGEDDTKFEKQTALFALAVADVVLINIWYHEIGREKASMKSLLQVVFEVMRKLYNPRKITLLFVIRDKSETPLEKLKSQLRSTMHEIWNSIPMRSSETKSDINQFFKIQVVALSHYKYPKDEFIREVSKLREQISGHNIGFAADDPLPASALVESFQGIWEEIKENKDIDIPSHKIRAGKLKSFLEDEEWCELKKKAERESVDKLGDKLGRLVKKYLSSFDAATLYFDENVKSVKRTELEEELLLNAREVYIFSMGHTRSKLWSQFKRDLVISKDGGKFTKDANNFTERALKQFDAASADSKPEQAIWNSDAIRNQLWNDIHEHVVGLISSQLPAILKEHEEKMKDALGDCVKTLLQQSEGDAWKKIRKYSAIQSQRIIQKYRLALSGFKEDKSMVELNVSFLKDFGEGLVKESARVESENALNLMVLRFFDVFLKDRDLSNSSKDEIDELIKKSHKECIKLLSDLAVIRLDASDSNSIENILDHSLLGSALSRGQLNSLENWMGVPKEHVLLTPRQCLQLWKAFNEKTSFTLRQKSGWVKFFEKFKQILLDVSSKLRGLFGKSTTTSDSRDIIGPL